VKTTQSTGYHSEHYYKKLTRQVWILIVLVSLIPLLLVNGFIALKFNTSYKEKTLENIKLIFLKHKIYIENFLNEKISNILLISDIYSFEELKSEDTLKKIFDNLKSNYGNVFVDIGVIDNEGNQISYVGPFKLKGINYKKEKWYNEAKNNIFYISDVFLGFRKLPHFIISVKKTANQKTYLIRATIDFFYFNKIVENIKIGHSGVAYIVNEDGKLQTSENPILESQSNIIKDILQKNDSRQGINYFEKKNELQELNIYLISKLENKNWYLIFQQPKKLAFGDLYFTQKIGIISLVLSTIFIVALSYLITRNLVRHIKKIDKEKEIMNEQIIEAGKLASLGELAAGIAHEINNPVAIMVEEAGWLEDILEESIQDRGKIEEFSRSLRQIKTQGKRCKEITHKLLSFARRIDSRVSKIQINEVINEVISLSARRAKFSNIKIKSILSPGLPEIYASPSELQQVFLNLINNSIDAIDEKKGGLITISTKRAKNQIICEITDTGCGIPKANLSRIFDPFFTTKPVGKGTGLGLSICYGIIKKMGGDIKVESEIGKGTTFTIYLPINKQGGENES